MIHIPCIATTEHVLPMRRVIISGDGLLFTEMARLAHKTSQIALIMMDSNGDYPETSQQLVTIANVESIDWLSEQQIKITMVCSEMGTLHSYKSIGLSDVAKHPMWPSVNSPEQAATLATPLELTEAVNIDVEQAANLNWLCYRWLEILPLQVSVKQRLLKAQDCRLCQRYLEKIIEKSDLLRLR